MDREQVKALITSLFTTLGEGLQVDAPNETQSSTSSALGQVGSSMVSIVDDIDWHIREVFGENK